MDVQGDLTVATTTAITKMHAVATCVKTSPKKPVVKAPPKKAAPANKKVVVQIKGAHGKGAQVTTVGALRIQAKKVAARKVAARKDAMKHGAPKCGKGMKLKCAGC